MNTKPKNIHAVALGKLGGRPKGTKGQPLTSDQARAMANARWSKRTQPETTTTQENKPQ